MFFTIPNFFCNFTQNTFRFMKKYFISVLLILTSTVSLLAQSKESPAEIYIKKYSHIAVSNMREYGIPASITIAQGLLESGNGLSTLAKKSNNHFGIKCKKNWEGERVYYDDDAPQECFRKYEKVEDSYSDHAVFLTSSLRYADLFKLKRDDYKGWAHGLKKAGYATNPKYPQILIGLIERYELHNLDKGKALLPKQESVKIKPIVAPAKKPNANASAGKIAAYIMGGRGVFRDKKELFVYAQKGDSYNKISKALKMSSKKLIRVNGGTDKLELGQKVYISKKRNKK